MILAQNDGVFPNVTNATGTISVASPSGTSVISANIARQLDQLVVDQAKRYNEAGNPIDNDEILPGYTKEKRQDTTCRVMCSPSSLDFICKGSPVFATCNADCKLDVSSPVMPPGGIIVGPLGDSNIKSYDDTMQDRVTCLEHCFCDAVRDEPVVGGASNEDDPFQGLD